MTTLKGVLTNETGAPFDVTLTSNPTTPSQPPPNWWTTAPKQASAAGYVSLKFGDDFTADATIAPNHSVTSGYDWYWADWGGAPVKGVNYTVNAGWRAGDSNMAAQGVAGDGGNASPNGGIIKLQGGASNATFLSCSGQSTQIPTVGVFQHGYFEAYIQYRPGDCTAAKCANGWPAFWSWSVENMRGLGFGSSPLSAPYTEIDFLEYAVGQNGLAWGGAALHGSMSGGPYNIKTPGVVIDNNWHTIGCLWTPGKLQFYYDNAPVGSAVVTSAALEAAHQFIMIGSGLHVDPSQQSIPMFVDWVRVWQ
jgi:Glycosyl hydrolases family 16